MNGITSFLQIINNTDYKTVRKGRMRWVDLIQCLKLHDQKYRLKDAEKAAIVQQVNASIAHWSADERDAQQIWWIDTEINENWDAGYVSYEELFNGILTKPDWLFYISKRDTNFTNFHEVRIGIRENS
jgi:hypothetical protein